VVMTTINMNIYIFHYLTSCRLVELYQRFKVSCCFLLQGRR
jgi:hypothetical protein